MNQYHRLFERLQEKNSFKGEQWFGERKRLVEEFSWAVPNEEVIEYLANFDHIVEIGAGNGYWAHLIEDAGGFVEAYDADPPEQTYHPVEERVAANVEVGEYPVLMVWPPIHDKMAEQVLHKKPAHVLYVGERVGGCTASKPFFDDLRKNYAAVQNISIPSYEGIHDNFYHHTRIR